ncbi:MAG TPA: response regulator [Pyrinomonadaceae bacterium]|jgi:CheY-like chemotaxis protein|nr:response regulator [Pyrinomonadaceae bacterium]
MGKRITMIEDSRETIVKFLESLPLNEQVELQPIAVDPFFDDGIEQAIKEFNPGLIILDLRLKRDEESGFRVLRRLKDSALLKDIPVVVCSKYIGKGDGDKNRQRAEKYNVAAALPKTPFPKAQEFLDHYKLKK